MKNKNLERDENLIGKQVSLIMSGADARRLESHIKSNTDLVNVKITDLDTRQSRVTVYAMAGETTFKRKLLLLVLRSFNTVINDYDPSEGMRLQID